MTILISTVIGLDNIDLEQWHLSNERPTQAYS